MITRNERNVFNVADPIVISVEAKFHKVRDDGWNNKLVQFTKGGILWGMHLSKHQSNEQGDTQIKGSLLCYGPVSEHCSDWRITFDHAFTLSCKRTGCASPIKKASILARRSNVISAVEWGEKKTPLPKNWGIHDNVKLSCHMYITQTSGVDRNALKEAAEPDPLRMNRSIESSPPLSSSPSIPVQTPEQIENEVMTCFTELLLEENIKYTPEALAAIERISQFFGFPGVLDVCRRHLMRRQAGKFNHEIEGENDYRRRRFDLHEFDYSGNTSLRRQRMRNLSEDDVVAIFQHLCLIAFSKS